MSTYLDFITKAEEFLNGENPSPNQILEHIRTRSIDSRREANRELHKRRELQKELTTTETRLVELQGINQRYIQDVAEVLCEEASKPQPELAEPA